MLAEGIKMLVPQQEIRIFLQPSSSIYSNPDIPKKYNIHVTFQGGLQNKVREYKSSVNLELFKDLPYVKKPKIAEELEKMRIAIEGLNLSRIQ